MSTDLLPLSGFALESCPAPAGAPGEGQTLTLSLRLGRSAITDTMTGRLSLRPSVAIEADTVRVGVVRVEEPPLVITL